MINGIIFDFDGVIADTELERFRIVRRILRGYGYELDKEDFIDFIGKRTAFFLRSRFDDMPENVIKQVVSCHRAEQLNNPEEKKLIPGIQELLIFLKLNGFKVAIATGSQRSIVKKVMDANNLSGSVDTIISGEDFKNSKPNPECFKIALKRLGLNSKDVIIIEDSIPGVKAAKSIGCRAFALSLYLMNGQLSAADNVFKNHFEILEHLRKKLVS